MNLAIWNRYHCIALLAASTFFLFYNSLILIVIIALASFVWLFIISRNEINRLKPFGGWANRVTGIRFVAILVLALINGKLSNVAIACWLAILIPLDGLDGYLARKRNEKTNMGAYFDMETDVLFVCIAACILFIRDLAGYQILIIAFIRYFYVFIIFLLGLYTIKEKQTKIGPIVAVIVFIALVLAFIVSAGIRVFIIDLALALILISFTYSFILLVNDYRLQKKS